jgi:tetratricopeptide (TPR) repeat protein
MRGACLMELDRFDAAAAELGRALELAAGERDLTALYSVTLAQAELAMTTGRLPEAEARLLAAHGLAAADPVREAIVKERTARLVSHAGTPEILDPAGTSETLDPTGDPETLRVAGASFRDHGRPHLAALTCLRLGFAFEARGELPRARAALEEGLAALAKETVTPLADAPYEVMAGRTSKLVPRALSRLAAIQRALSNPAPGRHPLIPPSSRTGGGNPGLAAETFDAAQAAALPDEPTALAQALSGARSADLALPDELADLARVLSGGGSVDLALPDELGGRSRVEGAESGMSESQEEGRPAGPA